MALRWILLIVPLAACSARNEVAYGSCQSSPACSEATPRCVSTTNRITMRQIGLCTTACVTSADCPDHGVCVNTESGALGMICAQRCTDASECRATGVMCTSIRTGESACTP